MRLSVHQRACLKDALSVNGVLKRYAGRSWSGVDVRMVFGKPEWSYEDEVILSLIRTGFFEVKRYRRSRFGSEPLEIAVLTNRLQYIESSND